MVRSALYRGQVRHTRYKPRRHAFRYRLFQVYLDLDELPQTLDRLWFCSSRRPAPVRFRRSDHLGPQDLSLQEAVRQKVVELGGEMPSGRICLLTHLRYFGFGFNPVSFYFCYDREDRPQCVLAEVNNTPWGEQHCYLVPMDVERPESQKTFHVSPFMDLDMSYRWAISDPGERLSVHIENLQNGERLFDASLVLQREPFSGPNLARNLFAFPFVTLKVIAAIYFEALCLWLKKTPVHIHTKPKETPVVANKQA
ncbi:MAG: DUF1365 domain-containing protein [Gammaproteobacteria bacterium]|nr:DUF1365 domain-containing protein [Gammaproteobacteria bacterium]